MLQSLQVFNFIDHWFWQHAQTKEPYSNLQKPTQFWRPLTQLGQVTEIIVFWGSVFVLSILLNLCHKVNLESISDLQSLQQH